MAHSGRTRHRDENAGERHFDEPEVKLADRAFRITGEEREQIAACLREIDDARDVLEQQQTVVNRPVIRALRAAADRVYDLLNELEEL